MATDLEHQRPKVGVGVYILNDQDELLLLHRKGKHGTNTWCPPGGHLEFGESFEECAKKEAKEESDLEVDDLEMIGVTNSIFEEEGRQSVTISMRAGRYAGVPEAMEPDKADDIRWFPLGALPEPLFLPVREFLESDPACLCGSGKKYKKCHGA